MSNPSGRGRRRPAFPITPRSKAWPDEIDLLLVILASLLAAIGFTFDLPIWIRLPLGLLATLALPGYALGMAIFPPGRLDGVERSALSFSLSIGAIVLAAPLINLAPGGLTQRAVVAGISAITIGGAAVAWWRRRDIGTQATAAAGAAESTARLSRSQVRRRLSLIVLSLALIGMASTLTRGAGSEQPTATEFFFLSAPATSGGVLERVVVGTPAVIALGITNHDSKVESYEIVVRSATERLAGRGPIVLAPEEPWTGRVAITLSEPGTAIEIRVLLFRNAEREPYRSLNLIVDAVAPS
jgi:uncharacterized membrane protein